MTIATPREPAAEIHKAPCKHCPSAHFPPDPESEHIRDLVQSGSAPASEFVFRCAWRPEKLCFGVCDFLTAPKVSP